MTELHSSKNAPHRWSFFRAGGFDQVRLSSGQDLAALAELDPKLWVALSCPTSGLEIDPATLALIDTDKDGRIRAPEIIEAARWACRCLRTPDNLLKGGSDELPLASINSDTPEGQQVISSARQILSHLGQADAASISLTDAADTAKVFTQTRFNGDGIVPVEAAEDPAVRALIEEIISCLGSQLDRSGKPGVSQELVDRFFEEAQAFSGWWGKGEDDPAVLPLGPATLEAYSAFSAVRAKIDDFFVRCRLAAFDPRAAAALNREEKDYISLAAHDLSLASEEIAALPLARVEAGRPLPLGQGVNPSWVSTLASFTAKTIVPLLGERSSLGENDWSVVQERLAPIEAWSGVKAGTAVEKLGIARVRELLASSGKADIEALIGKDKALESEFNNITSVERLIRYHRDLFQLLNNYVSFRDFYGRKEKAIFQAGTLYLDQRSCELCLRIEDMAKHSGMAHLSRAYLAYCDCQRRSTGEKMTIAAAFTAGDADNLMVGRNGIFFDRKGQDWDATIVKVVDNPISIRQAFWAPYKRALRWVEETIAKRASAADTAALDKLTATASSTLAGAEKGKAPPPAKPKIDIGVVAALGVAVGGITAALGMLLQAFFGLGIWMPLGLLALMLMVSGPSMIIAALKLRQRNIGPLLDAGGWAVNARARINIPFGGSLTGTARLPRGSSRNLVNPFAERHGKRNLLIILFLLLALAGLWFWGSLDRILPRKLRSSTVLGPQPAATAPAAPVTPAPAAPAAPASPAAKK